MARILRLGLLDSALQAPQASSAGQGFYPHFVDQAAVPVVRMARYHPLLDGNKRLAWQVLTLFCAQNGRSLTVSVDDAVATMLAVAADELDEPA